MTVLSVCNLRGGAGKTTTALYLSHIIANGYKKKVLLVDLDPQVSIGILYNMDLDKLAKFSIMKAFANKKMTGKCIYKLSENLSLLPSYMDLQDFEKQFSRVISSELMLKDLLEELKYDYIIIDTPPQYSILTKNAIMAADSMIIPIDPDRLSLEGASRLINNIDEIIETSPSRKEINIGKYYILPTQQKKKLMANFEKEFLKTIHKTFNYEDIKVLSPISDYDKLKEKQFRFKLLDGKIMTEYKKAAEDIING